MQKTGKRISLFALAAVLLCFSSCFRMREGQGEGGRGEASGSTGGETQKDNVIGDDGGDVGLMEGEYEKLLREGMGDLYPCQFVRVYAEDVADYKTFAPASAVNSLLTACGGESVTASYLTIDVWIDDDFICAHSPDFIVKFVDNSVLGENVFSTDGARAVRNGLLARRGIGQVPAVKTGSVTILSEELLNSERGKTLAKLVLASGMYPSLFPAVDLAEASLSLVGEGIFFYDGNNGT